jgi:Uma2 family endonuclease
MSQPAVAALAPQPFDFEIVFEDGEPLESPWHHEQMHLLFDLLREIRAEQRRTDVYIGANQFVYYSVEQAREVAAQVARRGTPEVRGPDVFWIAGVDPLREREGWVAWDEGGRLPDVIFELLSKSNTLAHREGKKELYAKVFGTAEYFVTGRKGRRLDGFRLAGGVYQPIVPDGRGRLWSEQLGLFVGLWQGWVGGQIQAGWARLYRPDGTLVPTPQERAEEERRRADAAEQRAEEEHRRAEEERQRAEVERRRAEAAETELARLRALVQEQTRD